MSLTSALYSAFSGLRANTRAAGLVSTNISNATSEGYGRRILNTSSSPLGTGGGVRIDGVMRLSDPVLTGDRMISDSQLSFSNDVRSFASQIERALGDSGDVGSLAGRLTTFENALVTAGANPASTQRLETVATTANDLALTLNSLSTEVQSARQSADSTIASQVTTLNETFSRLEEINASVVNAMSSGSDASSLLDERQRLLDSVSSIVPLRVVQRDQGQIAVFSTGGAVLLEGRASTISFTERDTITPDMTLTAGDLSGLTLNGNDLGTDINGLFSGGSLAAQFEIRDTHSVTYQGQLDGLAREMAERLGPGGPDTTLGVGDPGLFTDSGAAFVTADEVGFAGRISLNNAVAPGTGGSWRLRDGLGAATTGEVGDATLLQGIAAALTEQRVPGSASLSPVARSFADQTADFASAVVGDRVRAESDLSYQSAQNTALKELELAKGVDTDMELQNLMLIEQHYAANARMMTAVDQMMERLLAI